MKRELKFRAWNKSTETMLPEISLKAIYGTSLGSSENLIWLQYIGKKDKNSKEIYEDDVVIYTGYNWIVIYKDGCFMLKREYHKENCGTMKTRQYCRPVWSICEVIENIYEN